MSIFKRTPKPELITPLPSPKIGRLAIIVGHEKGAQGAKAISPINMSEYIFHTKVIVPIMQNECEKRNIECRVFLRDGSSISGVGAAVSDWTKNDPKTCAIELHFNDASGNPQGSEVLYDSTEKDNERFATLVLNRMCQTLQRQGKTNRGIKLTNYGRGAHNLTTVKCTGALCEPFFGGVRSECELMWQKHDEYARCLVWAAEDYLLSL